MTRWFRSWARGIARVGQVALVFGVLLAAAGAAVPAAVHAAGDQLLIVVSGSMTPTFRAGDVVLVHHPRPGELRAGMVVAFHAPGSPQRLTTHRIHSLRPKPYGLFLQTKGDANRTPDPDFVAAGDVVGVMGAHVPHVGWWLSRIQSPLGKLVLLGLPLLALILEQARSLWRAFGPVRLRMSAPAAVAIVALTLAATALVPGTHAVYSASAAVAGNAFATTAFCGSASTYASTIAADSPYAYYRLGEASGTAAADGASTPHAGTYRNTPTLKQAGAIKCDTNTAVGFDGATEYVSTATQVTSPPTTFTLETWFRTTTGGGRILGFGNATTGASTSVDRQLYLTNSGQVVFGVNPSTKKVITSPATYLDNAWHLVDATLDSSGNLRLYVDGAQVAASTGASTTTYSGYWRIAYDALTGWSNAPTSPYFKGTLDEVAIYPAALTAARVSAHFAANHS